MKYIAKNVFLDTNIYEGNNFFYGSNIRSIFYYSRMGIVNLYMTEISKMEIINRLKENLITIKTEHNKYVNFINKTRILKNLDEYSDIEKKFFNVDDTVQKLTDTLERNISSSNIKIISSQNVNVDKIFRLYYNGKAPFNSKIKKKYEFTDAFIVETINQWCIDNNTKMIFVTKDKDFNGYKSGRIMFRDNISKLLGEITNYYDSIRDKQIIPFINSQIEHNKNELIDLIEEELHTLISFDVDYEKISNIKYLKPKFSGFNITSIRDESQYAEVTLELVFPVSFYVLPNDIDVNRLVFEDSFRPHRILQKINIPCDIEVGLKNKNDIRIKWINSNNKINIQVE